MWCQNPFESPLHGFLIRNYKDPRVQDILIRTRAIFSDQPERVATYDRILSGKSLKGLEKYEADMQEGWGFAIRRKLASPFRSLVAPATPGAEKIAEAAKTVEEKAEAAGETATKAEEAAKKAAEAAEKLPASTPGFGFVAAALGILSLAFISLGRRI